MSNYSHMLMNIKGHQLRLGELRKAIDRFYKLHKHRDSRCVEVARKFSKYLSERGIKSKVVWNMVIPKRGWRKGYKYEHSWVELKIGQKWYVIDITGPRQFEFKTPLFTREKYRNLWMTSKKW